MCDGPNHKEESDKSAVMPSLSMKRLLIAESQIDPCEAADRIILMLRQEEVCFQTSARAHTGNHTDQSTPDRIAYSPGQKNCRMKMCNWCYKIVESIDVRRETVCIAMSYLDRFFTSEAGFRCRNCRSTYQLAALTSLHIAIKVHEPKYFDLELLVKLGRNCYSSKQILEMEMQILNALKWRMHPLTPMAFLQSMISMLPASLDPIASQKLCDIAVFQAELSVFDELLTAQRASIVAVAALQNAAGGINLALLPTDAVAELEDSLVKTGIVTKSASVKETRERLSVAVAVSRAFYHHHESTAGARCSPQAFPHESNDNARGLAACA